MSVALVGAFRALRDVSELQEQGELFASLLMEHQVEDVDSARALLDALEAPVFARAAQLGDVPKPLQVPSITALERLMNALGLRSLGDIYKMILEGRRVLEVEQRKCSLILDRAGSVPEEKLESFLVGFLSTSPAPLFEEKLEQELPDAMARARAEWTRQASFEFDGRDELLASVRGEDALEDPAAVAGLLARMREATPSHQRVVRAVLGGGDEDALLLAALLAGSTRERDFANAILSGFMRAGQDALALGVIAAKLDPLAARQVFSLFVADASWGNPEEPENQLTGPRAIALITARYLLPELGSPMEPMAVEASSREMIERFELPDVPALVERWRERWERILCAS